MQDVLRDIGFSGLAVTDSLDDATRKALAILGLHDAGDMARLHSQLVQIKRRQALILKNQKKLLLSRKLGKLAFAVLTEEEAEFAAMPQKKALTQLAENQTLVIQLKTGVKYQVRVVATNSEKRCKKYLFIINKGEFSTTATLQGCLTADGRFVVD